MRYLLLFLVGIMVSLSLIANEEDKKDKSYYAEGQGESKWRLTSEYRKVEEVKKKENTSDMIGIRKIAVLPFTDLTQKNREPAEMFADKLASRLVQSQMFDVKYPKEAIAVILEMGVEQKLNEFDEKLKIKLGEMLGVEALIFGEIKEMDLYEPTRVSYSLRMFLLNKKRDATTEEIWDLSSYGVPVDKVRKKDWNRFSTVWAPQKVYDSSKVDLQKRIKKYSKEHNFDDHAFSWEYVIRSNERFLEFITYEIVEDLKVAIDPKYQKKNGLWYKLKGVFRRN